ncbi:Oidioi.mRNA.OKI2018_I69.PAR.g11137.t1.cds [Oikopleura dioica]|uniref:Phospholipid scramblase n=1 Tax=Oikopleura dioica TaxID=34765 RepID=A0ABN7RU98_OIKDI|nr:Oidioi.mRNA.OKI2018_I69.PAR.g11137.t1.cds [Oikopleura dioica]
MNSVHPIQNEPITIQPNSQRFKAQISDAEAENYGKVEYLDGVRRVVIQQRLSLIEAFTDFDRRNKYDMWDADTGETLFFGHENEIGSRCQGYCIRGCFAGHREAEIPLQMAVNDVNEAYGGKGMYHLSKARAVGLQPCECECVASCHRCFHGCGGLCPRDACCGTCWMEKGLAHLSTYFKGNETHKIQQRDGGCGKASFFITDEVSKRVVFEIVKEEFCTSAICCNDVPYPIFDASGSQVGSITKYWAGGKTGCSACWQEANNASTHVISFPPTASHTEKLAIIGQAILIDYTYYQRKDDNNGGQ